jgi:hypothetical protein
MQKLLAIFIKHEVKGSASEGGNSNTGRDEPGACPADARASSRRGDFGHYLESVPA